MKIEALFRKVKLAVCGLVVLLVFYACGMTVPTIAYDDVYATNVKEHEQFFAEDSDNVIYNDSTYVKQKSHYREPIKRKVITESSNYDVDSLEYENQVNYAEFNEEDYYDYAYSARLRRFYSPFSYTDYYADYYTNLYWYTYDPLCWGTSIYLGYNWWYPSYYSCYWDPFYHHHFYHHHHHHPHHHYPYYDVCYFNSMDNNSNMYRPSSIGGSIKRAGNVSGNSMQKAILRGENNTSKRINVNKGIKSDNKNININNSTASKKYNKPTRSNNYSKSNVNNRRNSKVSTIDRQTNKSNRSFNRSNGSSFNRSSSSPSRSSGSSFGGSSRGGSRSGGSIRR